MLNKLRSNQGFTLIELLIVVAIIGILAAIAIPQFSSYRQKGFNSVAVSDLKNMQSAQVSLSTDNTTGWTEDAVTLAAATGAGGPSAVVIQGPTVPATIAVAGSCLAGLRPDGTVASAGIGVSNGVRAFSNTIAMAGPTAYIMAAKHTSGTRVYEVESGSTATMFVQNDSWAGVPMSTNTGTPSLGIVNTATVARVITTATPGGGSPTATWSAM